MISLLSQQKHVTTFVVSVEGLLGHEAKIHLKQLSRRLQEK